MGKIITYASGKNAEIIIWIVKRAREEHRKAIEWLNDNIDAKISFFLVEIELWQIDNSPLAPHFNVIERPNDRAKNVKNLESLSETNIATSFIVFPSTITVKSNPPEDIK